MNIWDYYKEYREGSPYGLCLDCGEFGILQENFPICVMCANKGVPSG